MLKLKKNPTLKDFQNYAKKMEKERGFDKESVEAKCLLLGEEIGELFKAIRKETKATRFDNNSKPTSIGEEFADVLMCLCVIANRLNIDLEQSFRDKEEINKKRVWK